MTTKTHPTETLSTDFKIDISDHGLGRNKPQQVGRKLVLPMFAMALIGFAGGLIVAIIRASELSDNGVSDTTEVLKHVGAGFMFIGFAAVFAAISFAIARILGEFRAGGGEVQDTIGTRTVNTLKMPISAKAFLGGMMMAMMLILIPVVLHFVFAADVSNTLASIEASEERFIVLEGVRRIGVALYLVAIAFGLATIIKVLRFESIRIRELPNN